MVQVNVAGMAVDSMGQQVLLLRPIDQVPGTGKLLPIWIGDPEATSIIVAIEGRLPPRPLAHDLMQSLVEALGGEVTQVEVSSVDEGTFFAEITIATAAGTHLVDARPSDAVALASRTGATIWVADTVMDEAGVPEMSIEPNEENAERIDEFKRFLEDVDPDDFKE